MTTGTQKERIRKPTKTRVLIADSRSLFRDAVTGVLHGEPDLEVVGGAGDGLEAVAEAERTRPNVALIEGDLPGGDGIQATYLVKDRCPQCAVILITNDDDQATLVAAIEAGADGYLTKEAPLSELIAAIRAVREGETSIPRHMLGQLVRSLLTQRNESKDARRRVALLSRREREVLALLAGGAGNDGIAQALMITAQTARTHIQNVLGKLKVHSRLEAAALVNQNGILEELTGVE